MTAQHRLAIALLAAAVLVALSALAAGAAPYQSRPQTDPQIADGTLQRRLDAARKRWDAAHLRSYRYAIRTTCFCAPSGAVVYVVRGGRPRALAPRGEASLATVPRLLRRVQAAIDASVANLDVTYSARGVPTAISIDGSANIADDEVAYAISGFRRLT